MLLIQRKLVYDKSNEAIYNDNNARKQHCQAHNLCFLPAGHRPIHDKGVFEGIYEVDYHQWPTQTQKCGQISEDNVLEFIAIPDLQILPIDVSWFRGSFNLKVNAANILQVLLRPANDSTNFLNKGEQGWNEVFVLLQKQKLNVGRSLEDNKCCAHE